MKRLVETRMSWDLKEIGRRLLATTLPISRGNKPPDAIRIKYISVNSDHVWKERVQGHICVEFDRKYGHDRDGMLDETALALMGVSHKLCKEKVMDGSMVFGGSGFTMGFQLLPKNKGFCEEAMMRVLALLSELGVKKEEVVTPVVTQRTLVWVPEKHPLRGEHYHKWGWIEYGTFLGDLNGLSSRVKIAT